MLEKNLSPNPESKKSILARKVSFDITGLPPNKKLFELFIGGADFANSFSELIDPIDQRKRLEDQVKLKDLGDEEAQPIDENFIPVSYTHLALPTKRIV